MMIVRGMRMMIWLTRMMREGKMMLTEVQMMARNEVNRILMMTGGTRKLKKGRCRVQETKTLAMMMTLAAQQRTTKVRLMGTVDMLKKKLLHSIIPALE
jgi:hypothetical protein